MTKDVIGVGSVSSEHPAKKMARTAVATTSRLITGLFMRLLPSSRLMGWLQSHYTG